MSVDARHCGSMGLLTAYLCNQNIAAIDFAYQHGTPVDIPRNKLFAEALASDVDVLVWMDSDCYIKTSDIRHAADLIIETHFQQWTFTTAACPQRDGNVNIWVGDDAPDYQNHYSEAQIIKKATSKFAHASRFPIAASGLGFAVFSLAKFRQNWAEGSWFRSMHAKMSDGKSCFQSEDFNFTRALSTMGEYDASMLPHCDPRFIVQHVHRGHHVED